LDLLIESTRGNTVKVIAGLVVAAGMSSRMKDFKPLLTLGGKSFIEHIVDNLRAGGVQEIVIVTGNRAKELENHLGNKNIHFILNEFFKTTPMYQSVKLGLEFLKNRCDEFFFLPGDIPIFKPRSLIEMKNTMEKNQCLFIQPMYAGKHGHPVLFSSACMPKFLAYDGANGLKGAMGSLTGNKIELALPDKGILMDADTQEDYKELLDYFFKMSIPGADECIEILKYYETDQYTIEHCIAVEKTATEFAEKLQNSGHTLDIRLVKAGALLHDVARRQKEHASCGAQWVEQLGYHEVAEIINTHMDLPEDSINLLDERSIVYLADKMVIKNQRVNLEERFNRAFSQYGENEHIMNSIKNRLDNGKKILNKIEQIIGG
jgi:molybdenum cofactor cytidylyltransferase